MKWWQFRRRDADLERELQSDLELEEEEQREAGLPSERARYSARRAFGNASRPAKPGDGRRSSVFGRIFVMHSGDYKGLRDLPLRPS
jgi:hypothetical protein